MLAYCFAAYLYIHANGNSVCAMWKRGKEEKRKRGKEEKRKRGKLDIDVEAIWFGRQLSINERMMERSGARDGVWTQEESERRTRRFRFGDGTQRWCTEREGDLDLHSSPIDSQLESCLHWSRHDDTPLAAVELSGFVILSPSPMAEFTE